MADEKLIGLGCCPVCSSLKARFTVSKKQLACMTCNACNSQIFARSDRSDELLRKRITPTEAPAAEFSPPAAAAAEPPLAPAPAPAKKRGWGILGAISA